MKIARLQFRDERTPYSPLFEDVYFSPVSGVDESTEVYLQGSGFLDSLASGMAVITVAEIGFGVGLNFLLTVEQFLRNAKSHQVLDYLSFEKFPVHRDDLARLYSAYPELARTADALLSAYPVLVPGIHSIRLFDGRVRLCLTLGDAAEMLGRMNFKADHWYWDGFAPSRNPDAFSDAIFHQVALHSKKETRGSSFTSAGWVRRALESAGFKVTKVPGFGKKRERITAVFQGEENEVPTPPWFSTRNHLLLNPDQNRVAVIGAGLAGSAIARALAGRGARVRVFDPNGIASRASGNPAGLFNAQISKVPNPISRFSQISLAHFLRELDSLALPVKRGILRKNLLDRSPLSASEYPEDFYHATDDGTFFESLGMINPVDLCRARLDHPAISLETQAVIRVERHGDRFTLHHPDGRTSEEFHHIVYAMGADPRLAGSTTLAHPILEALPTRPIRGQILLLKPTAESSRLSHCLVEEGYLTPLASGITKNEFHILGATYQAKTILPDQEEIDTEKLLEDSRKWPEIGEFSRSHVVSTRTGYRMSTPDKLPLIGPVVDPAWLKTAYQKILRGAWRETGPDLIPEPGEWMLTGLGSRGITYSSYGAEILASMMTGEPLPIALDLLEHVHAARFFVRKLREFTVK